MHVEFAAASNPTTLATALIALVGAVVGGAITAFSQWLIEAHRAKSEEKLERVRAERAETDAREAARKIGMVAARIMSDDFLRVGAQWKAELERKRWYSHQLPVTTLRVTHDERRVLAEQLDVPAWEAVTVAEGEIAVIDSVREMSHAEQGGPLGDEAARMVQDAIAHLEAARDALKPLADGPPKPTPTVGQATQAGGEPETAGG